MSDYDIKLNFKAEIIWCLPPETRAEQFARDHLNLLVKVQIKEFEMNLEQEIREHWVKNADFPKIMIGTDA